VRGLGEIALRVNDLDDMQKFYEKITGLPLMTKVPNCASFKIADGYCAHTQVLPLLRLLTCENRASFATAFGRAHDPATVRA
jgi:catechol-2,3-dioxygenase